MVEISLDGKVAFVSSVDGQPNRSMVAVHPIGVAIKDKEGFNRDGLRVYINVFFPTSFKQVTELESGDLVRVSGRITSFYQLPDKSGKNNIIIRMSVHGYSINKALKDTRVDVASELGVSF